MTIMVLAGSYQETSAFARQKGLGYGVRHIVRAESLLGSRPRTLHVLPSFYRRRDFHAINSALKSVERRTPHLERIEYELLATGVYAVASDRENAIEPQGDPELPAEVASRSRQKRVNAMSELDTSRDAVPGQIPIEDALRDVPVDEASVAAQNPRSDPGDDMSWLDD